MAASEGIVTATAGTEVPSVTFCKGPFSVEALEAAVVAVAFAVAFAVALVAREGATEPDVEANGVIAGAVSPVREVALLREGAEDKEVD